jgi:chorismate mutase
MTSIEDWRAEIDSLDSQILNLISARARAAIKVGEIKKAQHLPIMDPDREREVIDKICSANAGPLDNQAVERIFRRIIVESRRVEEQKSEQIGASNERRH